MYNLTSPKVIRKLELPKTEERTAFEQLKAVTTRAPVLAHPDFAAATQETRPINIYTDTSKEGLSAVLSQKGADKLLPHTLYFERSIPSRDYHVTDLDAAAVIFALRKFRFFIYELNV